MWVQLMGVEGLTRENVASHLQKYRLQLRKEGKDAPDGLLPNGALAEADRGAGPPSARARAQGQGGRGSSESDGGPLQVTMVSSLMASCRDCQ